MRVLGIAQDAGGKWGALYGALEEHFEVVDVVRPVLSRGQIGVEVLRNWRLNLRERELHMGYSTRPLDKRTRMVEAALAGRDDFDVVVQCQMLNAMPPGVDRPYTVYTDSCHALNQRHRFGGDPTPGRAGPKLQALEQTIVREAAHVFTMSEFVRAALIGDYGCSPGDVTVVGAGANFDVASGDGVVKDRPRAILVGVELERKGGREVLAAWPRVLEAVPDAELLIVGPPPDGEAPGVRWLGRVEDRAELSRLYMSSTVFVLPTLWDPWGLVYHEAMAHGLPCIGTDDFAVPEIIDDGETGILVPARAPDAVAEALIALLGDPARAAAMGEEARRRVAVEATWSAVAARMAPVLKALA